MVRDYRKEYHEIIQSASYSTITAERLTAVLLKLGYTSVVVQCPSLLTDAECKRIVDAYEVRAWRD
jgi:hypothetical protein